MKIYSYTNICDFNFWSGAKENVKYLTKDDLTVIELELEEMYPDGIEDTELNDLVRFDMDEVSKILGYDDFDDLKNRRKWNMKIKNHKIYSGNVNLYIPFQYTLYVIKCNHVVFNELAENISADIKSVCLYPSGDTMLEIEHKQKNVRLILKAFKMGLKVLNILDEEVKQVDFLDKIF